MRKTSKAEELWCQSIFLPVLGSMGEIAYEVKRLVILED